MEEKSVFQEVQERFSVVDVAKTLGLRIKKVGSSYRSDSLDGDGGENALAFYESDNTWHDFKLNIGGDVTALVAHVKFNGDMKEALHFLLPERDRQKFDHELWAKKHLMDTIELWHQNLFKPERKTSVEALAYLHKRGINDDTIRNLKIGINLFDYGGYRIVIPFWDDSGKNIIYYTSRKLDEENNPSPKYMKAPLKLYPFFRNAPMGLNSLKREKDETLIIAEGVFDFLAFYQEGYSVLSPNGGDFGKLWKEVLEKIKAFKRVILAFDSDDAGQSFTYKAAQELIKHKIPFSCVNLLTKDVADHYEATGNLNLIFNSVYSGHKWLLNYITPKTPFDELTVGEREKAMARCKDFIESIVPYAKHSDIHDLLISLRSYFPKDWISGLLEISRKGPSQADVADKVIASHDLMYNPRIGFFEYQDPAKVVSDKGTWKKIDNEVVLGYIKDRFGHFATGSKIASTLKLIQTDSNVYSEVPIYDFNSLPLINFKNGTLHIDPDTGQATFKPHSRFDYVTVQVPFFYDPKAKCPLWRKFVGDVTGGRKDDQKVLQEFSGYGLIPSCKFQKAIMLKGPGSNGKSVYLKINSAALGGIGRDGKGYVSSSEPNKWGRDFRLMSLRHSWINISSDMENDLIGAEGIFKKVVAGETLEDSYKHKDPIPFQPRTKLMVGCNFFPKINDTSDGFMRRWLIVEFDQHFVEKRKVRPFTNDKELDPNLEAKLMQELPGIFNWMLEGLQRLLAQNGFTHTAQQDKLIQEFRNANNPLAAFVEDNQEVFEGSDQGHIVPKQMVFDKYVEWADRNKIMPIPSNRFYSNVKSVFRNLSLPFDDDGRDWIFYTPEQPPEDIAAEV